MNELKVLIKNTNELINKIYELDENINDLQYIEFIEVEDFIFELKKVGLYTKDLEEFMNNYIKLRKEK